MRLVQGILDGKRFIAVSEDGMLRLLEGPATLYALALEAIESGGHLKDAVAAKLGSRRFPFAEVAAAGGLLPPIDHPDPAHCWVTGTGITHIGSATGRDQMHSGVSADGGSLSDSMRMFQLGLAGGKPAANAIGVQPEWFYKGDGTCVVPPGAPLAMPSFALSGAEEAEIVGVYLIGPDGTPWRLGFCLGNEFSDHEIEKENYLYGAHSKLRSCSIGPEMLLGDLPQHLEGSSRVYRGSDLIWEGRFLSGESNMSHSIRNLEYHHFKYAMFRRPGDVHCHFLGAAVFSYAEGIRPCPGDEFEIEVRSFGAPLRNPLTVVPEATAVAARSMR
jgi:hypothetical protein